MRWHRGLEESVRKRAHELLVRPLLEQPVFTLNLPEPVAESLCHYPSAFYALYAQYTIAFRAIAENFLVLILFCCLSFVLARALHALAARDTRAERKNIKHWAITPLQKGVTDRFVSFSGTYALDIRPLAFGAIRRCSVPPTDNRLSGCGLQPLHCDLC